MAHQTHHITHSHDNTHLRWDNSLTPILKISSGEEITLVLPDGGGNQFDAQSTAESISTFDLSKADPAVGPVYIENAQPRDVLKVEFLSLQPASYGWTAILPGSLNFGLLADEFPDQHLKIWDLQTYAKEGYTVFKKGIHIPIRPFLGVVGIAREEMGEWSTIPPYDTGGNIDCKYIVEGSCLYLPVKVEGALFSCGDGHAAQGDGEVCGTAIETRMTATLRLSVEKNKPWVKSPHFETSGIKSKEWENKGEYAVLGIDEDLREASRKAIRGMIEWLTGEKGLTREEGYMLASVASNLRIAEAVDMPHYAVACSMPLNIFVG
jgi:acetamidase/formamidase